MPHQKTTTHPALPCPLLRVFNDRETGLIKDVCDLNFNCAEYPKATLSAVDLSQLEIEARIDAVLHTFLPLSLEETYERYNRTPPRNADDVIPPSPQQKGTPGANTPGSVTPRADAPGSARDAEPFLDINGMTAKPRLLPDGDHGNSNHREHRAHGDNEPADLEVFKA